MTLKRPFYKSKILVLIIVSTLGTITNAAEPTTPAGAAGAGPSSSNPTTPPASENTTKNVPTPVVTQEQPTAAVTEPLKNPEAVKVSLTEADGYAAIFGGLSYNTGFQVGFAGEGGYRFFKKYPQIGVGANFSYNKIAANNQLMVFEGHAEYAMTEENAGFVFRLGLGYGMTARLSGFAISPAASYYIPVYENWTAGSQVTFDSIIGSRSLSTLSVFLGIRYWF